MWVKCFFNTFENSFELTSSTIIGFHEIYVVGDFITKDSFRENMA